ncbi:MAG TPA: FmdB family zinc ribbon protein [Longimicrobiales bacterium]|jgi:putative FmdB family regulatory protein
MPTYDYRCAEGHQFEVFQRMSDEPVTTCPECGARAERRISGGAGFIFKGEGFYITDSRSKEFKEKAMAESGGGGGETKADASGGSKDAAAGSSPDPKDTKRSKDMKDTKDTKGSKDSKGSGGSSESSGKGSKAGSGGKEG